LGVTESIRWLHETTDDGRVVFRAGRAQGGWVAEFVGVGTLRAGPAGTNASFDPAPGADAAHVAKIRHGLSEGLLRHLRGKLTLHASALAIGGRALVCLGPSGAGKSTTIADLCTRHGGSLLADDVSLLEITNREIEITPGERFHWLLDPTAPNTLTSGGRKRPVAALRPAPGPAPLVLGCHLVFDDGVTQPELRRLRGSEAVAAVVGACIRLALDDPDAHRRELDQVISLLERVPVYELRRPRRIELLGNAGDRLTGLLASPAPEPGAHG
jgi:hypothetical protein